MPSSNGSSTAACTHLMMLHGALKPRARRAIAFSVSLNRSGDSSVTLRSRTRRSGAFWATSICACATAPARRSPSTMASTMPLLLASGAGMWRPEMMASSAYLAPVRRGRRCVPPAPGSRPRWTSGRPTRVLASDDAIVRAQRRLQAAAQRRAVQGGDDDLGAVLHGGDDVVQAGALGRLAELADVGAGDEGAAAADQHDGVDVGVLAEGFDAVLDAVAHAGGERIHRRVVDGQDCDAPLGGAKHCVGHGCSSLENGHSSWPVLAIPERPAQRPRGSAVRRPRYLRCIIVELERRDVPMLPYDAERQRQVIGRHVIAIGRRVIGRQVHDLADDFSGRRRVGLGRRAAAAQDGDRVAAAGSSGGPARAGPAAATPIRTTSSLAMRMAASMGRRRA